MSEFPEKLELFGGIYYDNLSKESFMVYLKNARSSLISLKKRKSWRTVLSGLHSELCGRLSHVF
jgi:hypothetical protein